MTFPGRLLHKYVIWCTRTYLKIIPNLTTSSQHQYETLKKSYPNKHVIFNHFPSLVTQAIKNGRSQIEELKNTSDYILFFGTVDHYKGVDLLIEAYDQKVFHDRHKLVIAGKGRHYVTDNKNIIRLNRFIKDAEVRDLFTKAAIVVYPYRSATMSGVLSLAFYFRKKVVMSDVPFSKNTPTGTRCSSKPEMSKIWPTSCSRHWIPAAPAQMRICIQNSIQRIYWNKTI